MTTPPATTERELAMLGSLVTSLTETRTAIAALQAFEVTLLATAEALADEQTARLRSGDSREREMPRRAIAAEIGTATRTSDRTVQRRMGEAATLTRAYPVALRALQAGRIDRSHLTVIVETGTAITDASARTDFEHAAVALAERETPGRLRPLLRTLAARLDPGSIDTRHTTARQRRGVWVEDLDDGMAHLVATLPTAIAHAIRDRLTRLAHTVTDSRTGTQSSAARTEPGDPTTDSDASAAGTDEPASTDSGGSDRDSDESAPGIAPAEVDRRTIEQLRADVLADLLLTGDPTALPRTPEPIIATVQIVVPALTLLGTGTDPAELVGQAPIDTATARHLAATAPGWDRLLTHPVTGTILAVDRYRPTEDQRRYLRARDQHCRFPGCRMPVHRCDIDHTIDAALGGPTTTCNLAHLCRRHHTLKHATDWTLTQHPDGTLEWTSPTGRIHHDHPPSSIQFHPTPHPPPF